LSFLAADPGGSMDDTRRHLQTLITTHGHDWPAVRLEEQLGLAPWATRFRAYQARQGDNENDAPICDSPVC
ncbi:MAG TPA: hypothetical protein VM736_05155, partial [Gemmatimonadales bacterium]|nr:hypothetical protein [Gemmatimonadales bacterium]